MRDAISHYACETFFVTMQTLLHMPPPGREIYASISLRNTLQRETQFLHFVFGIAFPSPLVVATRGSCLEEEQVEH